MGYLDRTGSDGIGTGAGVAGVSGYMLSRTIGPAAWIPAAVAFGAFALLTKLVRRNIAVRAALSLIIAHTAWFSVGAIAIPDQVSAVLPDIIANAILGGLLFCWPGYTSAGLTILFQGTALYLTFTNLGEGLVGMERVMLAHYLLRLGIILAASAVIILRIHPDLDPDSEGLEVAESD